MPVTKCAKVALVLLSFSVSDGDNPERGIVATISFKTLYWKYFWFWEARCSPSRARTAPLICGE